MLQPKNDSDQSNGEPSWAELLEAARDGSEVALGEICDRFRQYLLLTAENGLESSLRQKFGASDVVQQAMLEGCRDFETFTGSSEQEFRAWMLRLVQHNLVDSVRQFRSTQRRDISREVPIEPSSRVNGNSGLDKTASSIVQRRETDEQLLRAIGRLPERQRRVIELRHRQGLAYSEIARQMDSNETAVRKLWERAVQSLRLQLTKEHGQERKSPGRSQPI